MFAIHDGLKASTVYILLLMENCSANGTYRNCPTERNACTCVSTMTHTSWYTHSMATYDRMCTKGHNENGHEGIVGNREVRGGMVASLFQ